MSTEKPPLQWPLHRVLRLALLRFLLPLAVIATGWLYLYPVFHLCAFPVPSPSPITATAYLATLAHHLPASIFQNAYADKHAPFRLLAFGDPQLEGDTSLPEGAPIATSLLTRLREAESISRFSRELRGILTADVPRAVAYTRKTLDLWGNDYYLAHIARAVRWWTGPTHVVVLGDLLGSQWIDDAEFESRGGRFWKRVFGEKRRVEDEITMRGAVGERVEELGGDAERWRERVMCVVGNHDVGYAGDMTPERVSRFERLFGGVNWDVRFRLPPRNSTSSTVSTPSDAETKPVPREQEDDIPELRIILLNTLNLDTPAVSPPLQESSYAFINNAITTSHPVTRRTHATILLTHLPLHKPAGVCVDTPFFAFHDDANGGGVKEQNHLGEGSTRAVLEGIFGLSPHVELADGRGRGRNGVILTGHDHEGCDVYHSADVENAGRVEHAWRAERWGKARKRGAVGSEEVPGIREVTVRSMMGDFGGSVGLLSGWFDWEAGEKGEWRFEYASCALGVQHWWWGVHILDLVTAGVAAVVLIGRIIGRTPAQDVAKVRKMSNGNAVTTEKKKLENGRANQLVGGTAGDSEPGSTKAGNGSIRRKRRTG